MDGDDQRRTLHRGEILTRPELVSLVQLSRKALRANNETRRTIQSYGVNIVPANFYSSVPGVDDIEHSFEFGYPEGPYNSPAIFDRAAMVEFLDRLDEYADEFDPPQESDAAAPHEYYWKNPAFSYSDAMAYYCMLRLMKPKHVLEIGSGFSTLVASRALRRNGVGKITCIEPFPKPWLEALEIDLRREPVQGFQADFFNAQLSDGDVLFIDSTHTVKAGSDCLHLYLRILPELKANLTIHAHDIHLPFPLPRSNFEKHLYWTEQYLLYALLLDNPRVMVLYGSVYHFRLNKAQLDRFMRGRSPCGGASFWFRFESGESLSANKNT
jgi:hypothetical protein